VDDGERQIHRIGVMTESLEVGSPAEPQLSSRLDEAPIVSLVVAMRNEARYIEACLRSIIVQDYPADRLEVWVFDGGSEDASREIALRVAGDRPRWHVGDNAEGHQAAAWNLGIRRATGEVIGILSAHAEIGPTYVREAVATLARTGAEMVGGPVRAVGEGVVAVAVARALSTPFGVGGARFRYLEREESVDSVFMGLCTRETFRRFEFDESMWRDQDDELSYRILDAGGRIVCNPRIESSYRSRSTIVGLWRQYLDYGRWKVRVIQKHPGQVRLRHLVPSALVLALATSAGLGTISPAGRIVLAAVAGSYLIANVLASAVAARGLAIRSAVLLPSVYATLHLSYGTGLILGLLTFREGWAPGSLKRAVRSLSALRQSPR
jgi:GT2 family glycosyltransferase